MLNRRNSSWRGDSAAVRSRTRFTCEGSRVVCVAGQLDLCGIGRELFDQPIEEQLETGRVERSVRVEHSAARRAPDTSPRSDQQRVAELADMPCVASGISRSRAATLAKPAEQTFEERLRLRRSRVVWLETLRDSSGALSSGRRCVPSRYALLSTSADRSSATRRVRVAAGADDRPCPSSTRRRIRPIRHGASGARPARSGRTPSTSSSPDPIMKST